MGLEELQAFLWRHRRIALDTSVFIYQLEANNRYLAFTDPVFAWLEKPGSSGVTSTITLAELLVPLYRLGREEQVDEIYALLSSYPNLEWIPPSLPIADLAAHYRALHRLRTPDALQAATAVHASASGLITNDAVFERVVGVEVLVLEPILHTRGS